MNARHVVTSKPFVTASALGLGAFAAWLAGWPWWVGMASAAAVEITVYTATILWHRMREETFNAPRN